MHPLASPPPLSRSLPSAIPGPGAQGRSPGIHPAQRCAWGPCTHGVIPQELGGEEAERGGKEQGDRSGCAHLTCLPQGTFPKSLGQATQHCTGELSPNSTLLGNLGESLSISVLPLGHSPPTVADIQPMPATASPGKDAFFLNPRSTSQKQGFFPFLIFMVGSSQSWHVLIRIRNAEKEVQQRSYDFLWAAEPRGGNN